ncbi:MAG: DNA-directed RNA polymerase subunit beta', partial [Gemmataceae bacterium]|nr:DNA-directed RNA polymerase subunit beta' [Gemmataceae bacterium]
MTDHDSAADAARIRLAGPADIRGWSSGEVENPKTIDPTTGRPVPGGLHCERIFGPVGDRERVRGRRAGHIELSAPVVHTWFVGRTNLLGTLLGLRRSHLQKVVYGQCHVVTDPGTSPLARGQLLTDEEHDQARATYGDAFRAGTGAAAVRELLLTLDLAKLSADLRAQLITRVKRAKPGSPQVRRLTERVKLVEELRDSGNRPEWLVLDCIPVIPPALRRGANRRADGDLDELYARVINRSQRLRKLADLNAPEVV